MSTRHIRLFSGELTNGNFDRLSEAVFEEMDYVIGLDFVVDYNPDHDVIGELSVYVRNDGLTLSKGTPEQGGCEISINGGVSRQMLVMQRVDGFYLVKGAGVLQGYSLAELKLVDEAYIRLNPAVKIIRLKL